MMKRSTEEFPPVELSNGPPVPQRFHPQCVIAALCPFALCESVRLRVKRDAKFAASTNAHDIIPILVLGVVLSPFFFPLLILTLRTHLAYEQLKRNRMMPAEWIMQQVELKAPRNSVARVTYT
jgi:hypothetical protein